MYQKVLPVKCLTSNYLHIYENNFCDSFYRDVALDTFLKGPTKDRHDEKKNTYVSRVNFFVVQLNSYSAYGFY